MKQNGSLRAKKSLGQHFLTDPHYLTAIADAARIAKGDRVIEIGPGRGHLTRELLARAQAVLAIELDEQLISPLKEEFPGAVNLEIIHADALTYRYAELEGTWKVVANLPYYISTPLIRRLIDHRSQFSTLTLMLQREVAQRIVSPPGSKDYGFLSVLVQLYAEAAMLFTVPAAAFSPRPEVDSAVIALSIRSRPCATIGDENFFFRLVKAAFSQRRKTLRNALRPIGISHDTLEELEQTTGIDLRRRAETLSIDEFSLLSNHLQSAERINRTEP